MTIENFWFLWENNETRLYNMIYVSVRNKMDAEDILHDTLVKAVVGYKKLKDPHKAKSWLSSITSNTIVDFYRRRKREQLWDIEQFDLILSHYEEASDNKIVISQFLDRLPDDWRTAVLLNLYFGISAREIAEMTEGSFHAIRSRLTRTYRLLAKSLSEKEIS